RLRQMLRRASPVTYQLSAAHPYCRGNGVGRGEGGGGTGVMRGAGTGRGEGDRVALRGGGGGGGTGAGGLQDGLHRKPSLYCVRVIRKPCTSLVSRNPSPTGGTTKSPIRASTPANVSSMQRACAPAAKFSFAAIS